MSTKEPRSTAALTVNTTIRGDVTPDQRRYAEEKLTRLAKLAHWPVLFARLELRHEPDPALERPAVAKASLDLSGRIVRAHVAAPTTTEAVDRLEARLRRKMEVLEEHREARRAETGLPAAGEWRHGDLPSHRPAFFPRPVESREIVRHKTFAANLMSPEEAVFEMELLDHDFLLFTNATTDADNVVYRKPEGGYGLMFDGEDPSRVSAYADTITVDPAPAPTLDLDSAIERLNADGEHFVFFIDATTGRGRVVYRRYDGHYGLIRSAEEPNSAS
jgi:ribosome-associated translation inhibitor RaiA